MRDKGRDVAEDGVTLRAVAVILMFFTNMNHHFRFGLEPPLLARFAHVLMLVTVMPLHGAPQPIGKRILGLPYIIVALHDRREVAHDVGIQSADARGLLFVLAGRSAG